MPGGSRTIDVTSPVEEDKVWLITGCSSGMGRDIAFEALERGYRVITSARNPSTLDEFVERFPERARAIRLDVTEEKEVEAAFAYTLRSFGQLDVLVNNAGYGYLAAIEEGEDEDVRAMFETNFWGTLAMTKAVLPHMRGRRSGQIINNSSQAGLMSKPGTGYYSMTKYAVEALSEALVEELAPWEIKVTAIEAGPFRTDWAGRSMKRTRSPIEDYGETVHARLAVIDELDGHQLGDPKRAARAIVDLARCEAPPRQLLMSRVVLDAYRTKLEAVRTSLDEWEEVTLETDFPPEEE
ncbi:MAG: SDR family NAD(P)-dependent oxidoreductase [bacterium]|nr:short-chain dehydrogenase/reductase [Deltaproteobacteria bacterium]MCP4908401.1 SDR family NAD(P)-dependent oxidoreductase [bacterium]